MPKNDEKAKQMFFNNACSHSLMLNDGLFEEYRRFGISQDQEKEWRQEYIAFWVGQLSTEDLTAVNRLRDAWASEALPDLIRMASLGDGLAKLWYANAIWNLAKDPGIPESLRKQARGTARNIWQSLINEPIVLTKSHRAQISREMRVALHASKPEEYVVNYAKSAMAEATKS